MPGISLRIRTYRDGWVCPVKSVPCAELLSKVRRDPELLTA